MTPKNNLKQPNQDFVDNQLFFKLEMIVKPNEQNALLQDRQQLSVTTPDSRDVAPLDAQNESLRVVQYTWSVPSR